jgi:two-component system, NarL family, response regulator NreC
MALPLPAPAVSVDARTQATRERPITVLLADDHDQMRRDLCLLLEREEVLEVIAHSADLSTLERHLRERLPRVLVLELAAYGGSSIGHIRRLRRAAPGTRIVVLSTDDDPIFARHALEAGASGFVLKDMADAELPEAIVHAARGSEYVSPRLRAQLQTLGRSSVADTLTARETEVLRLIALGHTSVEIAGKLQLSPRTVETHRAHIYRKLGFTTRAQAVRYALGRGLLSA